MASTRVELYKQQLLRDGYDPNQYTDEQLTAFLGQYYEGQGLSRSEIEQNFGSDFSNEYLDLKNRPDPEQGFFDEFTSGVRSSAYGLASTGVGALGLGAGAVGLDGAEDFLMEKAAGLSEEASKDRPTIDRASDVRWSNPAEVARFLSGGFGEALPSVAESALAFAGGGGVGYALAKKKAKDALRKTIKARTEGTAGDQAEALLKEVVRQQAREGAVKGSMISTGISSLGLGMGEIYSELYPNTKLDQSDPDYIDDSRARSIAMGFGAVSGGLDFAGAATLLGKLTGSTGEVASSYLRRLLLGLPEGIFVEGGTEAMQEFINVAAEKYAKGMEIELNGQELDRLFDAGVLGAVGGVQFTAIGALKGPKREADNFDDSTPVAEDLTQIKQQNLLEDLQKNSAEEQINFEVGDEVQIALGESGVVHDIVGNTIVLKMPDGTLKTKVDPRTLSHKIDIPEPPKASEVAEPEKKAPVRNTTKKTVLESGREVTRISPERIITVDINGVKVDADESVAKDAQALYYRMKEFAEKGKMSKNTATANRSNGWASNNKDDLKLNLGKDAKLLNRDTLALLRNAGVLNASNEWTLATAVDTKFDKEENQRVIQNRKAKIADKKLTVDKKVKIRGGSEGTIESITDEGKVVVDGVEYEPTKVIPRDRQATKVNAPTAPQKTPTSEVEKEAQEEIQEESKALFVRQVDENGQVSYETSGEFEGFGKSKIRLLWKLTNGRAAKRTDNAFLKGSSAEEFSDSVRKFIAQKQGALDKTLKEDAPDWAKTLLFGVEIDGVDYSVDIDENGDIDIAGFKVPPVDPNELEKKKGELPALLTAKIDESLDDALDSNSKLTGELSKDITGGKTLLVLRQGGNEDSKYRPDTIRVVSVKRAEYQKKSVHKAYNGDYEGYIRFRGEPGGGIQKHTYAGWDIVGKIVTTEAVGDVDLYFESLEELQSREDLKKAIDQGLATQKETAKFAEGVKAEQKIDKLLEPTEEEYKQAFDEIYGQARESGEELTDEQEIELEKLTDRRAREIAKERVDSDKEVSREVKTEQRKADRATGRGSDYEARLKRFEEVAQDIRDDDSIPANEKDDAIAIARNQIIGKIKNEQMGGSATRQSQQFETGGAFDKAIGETDENLGDRFNETASLADLDEAEGSSDEANISNEEIEFGTGDEDVTLESDDPAGRGLVKFADLDLSKPSILNLFIGATAPFKDQLLSIYRDYKEIKEGIREQDELFHDSIDKYLQAFYDQYADVQFKSETLNRSKVEFLTDLLASDASRIRMAEMHDKLIQVLDILEAGNVDKKDTRRRDDDINIAKELVRKAQDSYAIFDKIMSVEGHPSGTEGNKAFLNAATELFANPDSRIDSTPLSLDEIVDAFAKILSDAGFDTFNKDSFRETLLEVFEVKEVNEDDRSPEYRNMRNYVKSFFNPAYVLEDVKETPEVGLPQGKRYHDPLEEGKLNRGQQRIDNLYDPTTGEVTRDQVLVVSDETNKASIDNARQSKQAYMAPEQNPLSAYPDLIDEGRTAMNAFAPSGMGVPFNLTTALNQIKESNPEMSSIANIARLLGSKTLQGFEIEFMSWKDFRPYASPAKGVLNKAVIVHEKKKILISDAFNNNTTHSAMDTLMADILHEAVHAVTRPALDLGYAYSTGKSGLIQDTIRKHGLPEDFNLSGEALGKIWSDFNDKLLPYLREQGKKDLDLLYGLSSIDEFFSELASDRKFMDFLDSVQMPKDMLPPKSKLRTVLDYILNLLAKLGFKVARTDTALTYAREELRKLMDISNQTTELSERITAMNLRDITTLASRFDTNDINLDYNELLERISQETARDGTGGNLEDASRYISSSTPTGNRGERLGLQGKERDAWRKRFEDRTERQGQAALEFATQNGLLINREDFDAKHKAYSSTLNKRGQGIIGEDGTNFNAGGAESEIYLDEESQRIFKRNNLEIHDGDITEYLNRLLIHNHLFPSTAYKLEGFEISEFMGAQVTRPVVSQPFIKGRASTREEIEAELNNLGLGFNSKFSNSTVVGNDINVSDLRGDNAITDEQGLVHIIDPIIEQEQVRRVVLERKIDKQEDPKDILKTLIELYSIPGYVPDASMKALRRSVEDELSGTKITEEDIELLKALGDDPPTPYLKKKFPLSFAGAIGTTVQGNQFTTPNDSPRPTNPRPDDNARIMSEANAAGFNELVNELVKVYREVGEDLGIKLEDFLDEYGRPGSKKLSEIKKILDKELSQHNKSSEGINIDDAGLNRVARNFGVRKAIGNLEAVREKARKNKSRATLIKEEITQEIIEGRNMYGDLLKGRFPPRNKIGERVKSRLVSTKFEILEEYVRALPNSGFSQENLNDIRDITTEELLDIMDLVAERDIDGLTKAEFNAQLESISDSRLDVIKGNTLQRKARRYAVLRAIKESKDAMSLLRLSKNMIGTLEERYQEAANQIARADSVTAVDGVALNFPGVMNTPLRAFADLKKFELENENRLRKQTQLSEIYEKINSSLEDRSTRLRMALGELQPVNIYDGVTLLVAKKVDGKWERDTYKVDIKGGKFKDREGFSKANKDTLMFIRDDEMIKKHGHEPWFEIMREQALLALNEPIMEEQFHVQRAAWYASLQGLTERFNKLGYAGKKLSQMSTRTVALYRDYATTSQSYAKQFNASLHRVMGKLKLGGNEIYTGLYQDIFWWFDNHPEYAGKEEEGFRELWKYLKGNANVPDRTLLDEEARRLIMDMVNKSITARNWEAEVNKRLGNRVRDEEIKVESFINQEMVDFYRLPLEMGYATMPRTLNDGYLMETNRIMKDAKWHGEDVKGILNESAKISDPEEMRKVYSTLFNDDVVQRFVKPFTNTDVRQSVFRGPKDNEGDSLPMGNSFVSTAFEETNGDVYEMSNYIFDRLSEDQTDQARAEWQYNFLRQFFKRYRQLQRVANRVGNEKHGMHAGETMRHTPQSMDARMVESRLPKEFFYYNMYDEVSSNIRLALQVATSQFGRNGDNANIAYLEGKQSLSEGAERFNNLMSVATKSRHTKPQRVYSRKAKREALRILREDDREENAERVWNDLYSKAVALGEIQVAFDHLGKYYGKSNVAGPYQDANLLMDILGVQSVAVLNNPKSSMMQALSLFEFPNAFRGLNRLAGKGTAGALGNFINQTFGGMLEAMGVELEKTGRYAQYLNNTHFRMDEMDLPFKEYNSIVGSGGDLAQSIKDSPGLGIKKMVRKLNNIAQHHRRYNKDGTRAPVDPLSLITGIFPYINNVVNHSVGVGAIHAYSDLVLQMAEVIESRGLTEYTELTAEDLGMGNTMGEWIAGEKDGFDRANEMLIGAGAPSVSRLAFDFVDRKKSDKNAMPIERNMALLINQVAMNQVSGEGFNSKPSNLYNNDFLKYFATFLGWPLGKMSRDLQQIFRDPSDRVATYQALLKYLGMMSVVYAPVGLSFAMLIDWYDEEMLEKPNNLPPISPWAALPVLGPFIAMDDPNFSVYAITSRLAKAGVPFGMGMDLANGLFAKGDPYGAAREISLDSRIFAWSMFKNIYDAMGTWAVAGEFDWQLIGRPIVYGVGGNSVIQMMDLTSAILDIDSEERRVADYIAMRNNIKKTAYLMGLPLKPPRKGGGTQSGVSINTRQMARAAFAGDSEDFLVQYQEAVEAAREYLQEKGRSDDPEKYVADRFKERDIRFGITEGRMSDADFENLMQILDPDERAKIQNAIQAHEHYLRLIGGTPRVSRESRMAERYEDARKLAASLAR